MRIFFGHQSVGADLLLGVSELQAQLAMNAMPIVASHSLARMPHRRLIAHARIGRNGDPGSKLEDFRAALRGGLGQQVDLAMLKFCYVDVTDAAAAERTFELYVRTMTDVAREFPRLALAHVTMPLRCPAAGLLGCVRERIQGPDPEHERNRARALFNQRLVAQYANVAPVFDLADAESRLPDGSRHGLSGNGDFVPALARAYTKDGGHLNRRGRRIAALAFLDFLSEVQASPCR